MSTSKRFYLNDTLSLVSTVLEDCVNRTMVGQAFGVDTGDTWELASHSSDEIEDWSDPKRYVVSVEGHVTHVLVADMGDQAREPAYNVLAVEVSAVGDEVTEVLVDFHQPDLREHFNGLMAEIARHWPHVKGMETEPEPTLPQAPCRTRGPTINTQSRAEYFKNLKDKHPEWSYARIALVASLPIEEGGYGEIVTEHTVRNAYRAMGWKWARSDRVR